MLVYKFGGTSVRDAERIRASAVLALEAPEPPVVVVSAMAGVTLELRQAVAALGGPSGEPDSDLVHRLRRRHHEAVAALVPEEGERGPLIEAIDRVSARLEEVLRESAGERFGESAAGTGSGTASASGTHGDVAPPPPATVDRILAAGEDLCAPLMAAAIRAAGGEAELVEAREVVRTNASFGAAAPDLAATRVLAAERLAPLLRSGRIPVIQGFVGATEEGETTTLGLGGSDHTATLLGSVLGAHEVCIWTDVDGILSADPTSVEGVRVLPEIGFEEAVELSYFGAKVLHPGAAKEAVAGGIPVRIRNSFRPESPGTRVVQDRPGTAEIAAVAYKPGVVLFKVRAHPSSMAYGFLARVFDVLGRHQVPVDLVSTSHTSTAFTVDIRQDLTEVAAELSLFADVTMIRDLATVTVVGRGLMAEPGMAALVFWATGGTTIQLISLASDVSLSFLVPAQDATEVVRRIHRGVIELRGMAQERGTARPFALARTPRAAGGAGGTGAAGGARGAGP